jgi:hypothetical protein
MDSFLSEGKRYSGFSKLTLIASFFVCFISCYFVGFLGCFGSMGFLMFFPVIEKRLVHIVLPRIMRFFIYGVKILI